MLFWLALLPTVAAVVPGSYCGTLSLPLGLGHNHAVATVHPDRRHLDFELHGPHLDMYCRQQSFTTAGYGVHFDKGCVPRWVHDHGLKIVNITHDPRATTLTIELEKKWALVTFHRTLHMARCASSDAKAEPQSP